MALVGKTPNYNHKGVAYQDKWYATTKSHLESEVEKDEEFLFQNYNTGYGNFTQNQLNIRSNVGFVNGDVQFVSVDAENKSISPKTFSEPIELVGIARTNAFGVNLSSPDTNPYVYGSPSLHPITDAASKSISHAILGLQANRSFYLYMLSKGYVYKDGDISLKSSIFDPVPLSWANASEDAVTITDFPPGAMSNETQNNFFIPHRDYHFVDSVKAFDLSVENPFATPMDADYEQWEPKKLEILIPSLHPSYGRILSPTTRLNITKQEEIHNFYDSAFVYLYGTGEIGGVAAEFPDPENNSDFLLIKEEVQKYAPIYITPTWCEDWRTVWFDDKPISSDNPPTNDAPAYKATIKIDLEKFFEQFLKGNNIIEYNKELADQKIQEYFGSAQFFAEYVPDTGDTTKVYIPGIGGTQLVISEFQQDIIDSINNSLVEPEEVFGLGPIFKDSTHFINDQVIKITKKENSLSRSVLNEFTKYDKDGKARVQRVTSYEKDKYTSFTLPYGTTVKVVDEFIDRPSGLFHMIQTVDGSYPKFQSKESFYIKAELLTKLPQTLPSLNTNFKNYVKSKEKIEWINMKDEEIFFDRRLLAYSVVVEPRDSSGKKVSTMLECQKTINDLENIAMRHGIHALMSCHNKKFFINDNVSDTLDHLMNGVFQFAYTGENVLESKKGLSWYLDPRPKSKLRFIVRIPAKYFDALAQKPETFEDIPHVKKQLFTPEGQQPIDAAPMPSTGVSDFRVTTLLTCNVQHKIDMAVSIMKKYKEQIDAWDGEVQGLDLDLEIQRLQSFPQAIQKFVVENNFRYRDQGEDELEIGCNSKFRLKYISYVRAGLSKPLRICFNRFKRKSPVKFSRTMGYIYYLDDIIELERKLVTGASEQNGMNWVEFVQRFTYPMPAIRPSSRKATSPLASNTIVNKQDEAKKLAEKYNKIVELTPKFLDSQIKELSSPDLKLKLASSRLQHKDFSGDVFVEKIPELVEAIRNLSPDFDGLQNLFTLVFDKIDIATLSSISAGALSVDMPTLDIENAFSLAALDSPEISGAQFNKIFDFLPEVTINKISLAESYFDGSISISDIENEFPDDVLNKILDFFDKKEQKVAPKGREAEIMKKGSLEDIKCLGLDAKYGTASPRLDDRQNTKKELIKMIASPEQLVSAITKVVPDIVNSMSEIGQVGNKDVPSLSLSSLKKGAVKFPKPPTITIPKIKSIDDTMPNISKDLTAGLEQVLATVLIETSAMILETVFNAVFSSATKLGQAGVDSFPSEFGGQDINELLEDFNPANQDAVENAMKKLGIGPSTEQYDIDIDQIAEEMAIDNTGGDATTEATPKTSKQIISEISSVLTPLEVVDLLEGTPSSEALQVVEGLMGEGNQALLDGINKTTSVRELFKNLGKLADPNKLEAIRNTVDQILPNPSGLLCEYENFTTIGEKDSPGDVIRRRALEGKLDKECVESQMALIRQRKTERLANMLSLANGKDILAGEIPPLIGSCGKGVINKNHPTVEHMNEKLTTAIFDPIKMNFSTEANTIGNSYTDSEPKPPTQFDDQYDALKASLFNANFMTETDDGPTNEPQFSSIDKVTDKFVNDGFAEKLPKNQQTKFNNVASQFYVYDGTLAPKIRKIYTEKVSTQQIPADGPKQLKLRVKYSELGVSEKVQELEKVKNQVDSLINKIKNLDKKIASGVGDTSTFSLEQKKEALEQSLGNRSDDPDGNTIFAKYNAQLEKVKNLDPDERLKPVTSLSKMVYFTKDREEGQSSQLLDTWRVSIPSDVSKKIFTNRFGTQGSDYKIYGYNTLDPNIIPSQVENEYVFFPGFNERDQVFANILIEQWNNIAGLGVVRQATNNEETIDDFYRDKRSRLLKYFINAFALKIPSSKYFDGTIFSELDLGSGKYDANFDASGKCSPDKTDNILGIEDLKRQAREEYNNSCDDDEDPTKPGGLEKANLRALMRASIRISILEAVSRAIFMGGIYSMEDMLKDPALVEFFTEMVKGDLLFQDNEYYEEFLIQAKQITDEKLKKGEKLLDSFTKLEDTKLIHVDDPKTQNGENSLQFIVREELKYLSAKVDERLRPEHKNIDDYFLNEMIPTVDVRRHYQENILYKLLAGSDTTLPQQSKLEKEFGFLSPDNNLTDGAGGFVLEKYVRVVDASLLDTEEKKQGLTQKEIDFINEWHQRPGGRANANYKPTLAEIVDVGKVNSYAYTTGAVNIKAFKEALQKLANESDIEEINFSKLVSNFKFGLRLVYIPPQVDSSGFIGTEQQYKGKSLDGFTPLYAQDDLSGYTQQLEDSFQENIDNLKVKIGFGKIIENYITSNVNETVDSKIDFAARRDKIFRTQDTYSEFITQANSTFVDGDVQVSGYEIKQNVKIKTTYPISVVKVEDDFGFIETLQQENGKINITQMIEAFDDLVLLTSIENGLKERMKKESMYKFALHYDIPIRRALSLLFVHQNLTSAKNYQNITRTFSLSKDMLRSSFFNMIPGSQWWSKQDKRIADQGGNSGMMETANNTMTMDGPSGSDIATKIAIQAAIIITKALAAQQDPNYALMKKLDTFGLTLGGMSWKSVPVLYPINFPLPFPPFVGWGPPMTPLGMVAYSLPFLPGESKKNKSKEQNKQEENSEC